MYKPYISYYYPYHMRVNPADTLINDIRKAIDGEYSAIACYEQIAKLAPTNEIRDQILEIRQDEIRHFETFSQIYTSLTGNKPTPTIKEPCPKMYQQGLEFALKDEQETVDFYLDTADSTQDPTIMHQFRRAAADEQNHAVWFLYFFTKSHAHRQII